MAEPPTTAPTLKRIQSIELGCLVRLCSAFLLSISVPSVPLHLPVQSPLLFHSSKPFSYLVCSLLVALKKGIG